MDAVFVDLRPYLAIFNSQLVGIEVRLFHSGLALRHIVVVNLLDLGEKDCKGDEVEPGHQSKHDFADCPGGRRCDICPDKEEERHDDTGGPDQFSAGFLAHISAKICKTRLPFVIIRNAGGIGKKEQRKCDDHAADAVGKGGVCGFLHPHNARGHGFGLGRHLRGTLSNVHKGAVGAQHVEAVGDKRHDAGTEANRHVNIHGEGIHQALRGRVRGFRGSRGGRRFAEAGAGGIYRALDAIGESAAHHSAKHGVDIERASDHHGECIRNCAGIVHKNRNCDNQVANGHKGNNNGGELGDAAYASGDDEEQQDGDNHAGENTAHTEAVFKSHGNVVGAGASDQQGNANGSKQGKDNCKRLAKPLPGDTFFHIEVRAAAVLAVHADLINLTEAVFGIGNCGGDQRGYNHPENRARAAVHDCNHDAANVAHRNTISGNGAEGFKCGQTRLRTGARSQKLPLQLRLGDIAEFHRNAVNDGKTKGQRDQGSCPKQVIDGHDE